MLSPILTGLRLLAASLCFLGAAFGREILERLGAHLASGSSESTRLAVDALFRDAACPAAIVCLLAGAGILVAPWVVGFIRRRRFFSAGTSGSDRGFLVGMFLACVAAGLAVNGFVFGDYMITPDENTYVNQARFFARGGLYGEAPPMPEAFEEPYLAHEGGRLFSIFQPGWSVLLTPGVLVGFQRIIPPLTAAFSLVVVFFLGRRLFGRGVARAAALIMLFSPYFLFHAGTYYSHIAGLLWTCLFALCFVKARDERKDAYFLLAGLCVAGAFLTRYFNLVFGLPFGMLLVWDLVVARRKGALKRILLFVCPVVAGGCLAVAYQWVLTGDPLVAPHEVYIRKARYIYILSKLDDPFHIYGFSSVYTPAQAILRLASRWWSLNFWIFPMACVFLVPVLLRPGKWEILFLLGFLALSLAYVPYFPPGGLEYGPRYFFPVFGPLALVIAKGVEASFGFFQRKWGQGRSVQALANWLFACLVVNLCASVTIGAGVRLVVRGATDLDRVLARRGVHEGIVFLTMHPEMFAPGNIDKTHPQECRDIPYYLIHNEGDYRQPLLLAHSLGREEDRRLMAIYPGRRFYLFRADPFAAALGLGSGELVELGPGGGPEREPGEASSGRDSTGGGKGRF